MVWCIKYQVVRSKSKGTNAERELIKLFHDHGWAPMRAAGSGCSPIPLPDIVASNGNRYVALECKTSAKKAIYIKNQEIHQLDKFSTLFGAEAWIAVRFSRKEWQFYRIADMHKKEKSFCVNPENKGIGFSDLINIEEEQ